MILYLQWNQTLLNHPWRYYQLDFTPTTGFFSDWTSPSAYDLWLRKAYAYNENMLHVESVWGDGFVITPWILL